MTKTGISEERELKEDPSMFITMIRAQAGTLSKAALEGVMNSIDSFFRMSQTGRELPPRPLITITLTTTKLTIEDNAMGFLTRDEILDIWETFGTPHPTDSDGFANDTKYGKFRIGRGQLFAFGKNVWRSNAFQMETDINTRARRYTLTHDLSHHPGCRVEVELYDSLTLRDVQNTVDEITRFCRYVDVDLVVNGQKVNTPPASLKWDVVTDDVYLNRKVTQERYCAGAGLEVYQQGVFVENIRGAEFGIEGTVVLRNEVELNFARNQVLRRCKRWRRIAQLLKADGIEQTVRKRRLTNYEARNFLEEFSGGNGSVKFSQFWNTSCLLDVTGKLWSPEKIRIAADTSSKNPKIERDADGCLRIGFAPRGDKLATVVMDLRQALVLSTCVLQQLRVDHIEDPVEMAETALNTIRGLDNHSNPLQCYDRFFGKLRLVTDLNSLVGAESSTFVRFSVDLYTERERQFVKAVQDLYNRMDKDINGSEARDRRMIGVGSSKLKKVWTDGRSFICFDRKYISKLSLGQECAWYEAALRVAEMFAHKGSSLEDAAEASPEWMRDCIEAMRATPWYARWAYQSYRHIVTRRSKRMPKQMQDELNRTAETRALDELLFPEAPEDEIDVAGENLTTGGRA